MSLHYLVKLEILIRHVLPLGCYRRNSRIYSTSTVAPNLPDLNPLDYSTWGYYKISLRRCIKYASLI